MASDHIPNVFLVHLTAFPRIPALGAGVGAGGMAAGIVTEGTARGRTDAIVGGTTEKTVELIGKEAAG
jgi:hypothetical protein